ncbi:MAG: cytochrome C552, partial [Alphaproteobacteria bacterium]|nr:cytochrome C552 [Alphaproteobacteria bacterium]
APFAEGGKMDPASQVKLAIMLDQGKVTDANRSGCWSTCHHDLKSMPDMPGAPVTKYLPQSRTEIAMDSSGKRGGWDKKKSPAELEQMLKDGVFLDLIRWKSNGEVEDGYVLGERVTTGGQGAEVAATQADGTWTVVLSRKLVSDKPGDVSLTPGKTYTIGFAIHDDHSLARFHHVSVEYSLGLDAADAAINVVKR